ncbi:uncharacterized protein LOC123547128 isoform X2 [Mercenaria mercenaria]|uniref:uncharacterized protein LOC123547128 isoform X2 n=1 Tax=Mercenaria mercenaria TaxID=6596 RepID=UPI00234F7F2F|nr:uncharacterized protein LOC123547128 isoform X2 [Mercenaria mercenaria]
MTSLQRNSLFRSMSMSTKDQGHRPEVITRKQKPSSLKPVSSSMDNMLLEMSRDTLEEWFPGTSDFSRTEGMQCLIIPDKVLFTEIVRQQRSFSLNYGCGHCSLEEEISHRDRNLPLTRSASLKTPVRKNLTNTVGTLSKGQTRDTDTIPRSRTMHSFSQEERKAESGVQLRRCLSFNETKRNSHACCHLTSPPKTYGRSPTPTEKQRSKSNAQSRVRTSSSLSLDSVGLSNGCASTMSVTSRSSSECDFDLSPRKSKVSGSPNKRQNYETETTKPVRPSHIPRPVTPARDLKHRPRCFTVSGTSTADFASLNKRSYPGNLKKSQSFKERTKPGVVRSAPSSAAQTPTNAWIANGVCSLQSRDLTASLETLDGIRQSDGKYSTVPDEEEGYPVPQPPGKTRAEIYNHRDFVHVDECVSEGNEAVLLDSFDELLKFLLEDLTTDITKVRALYRWLVTQQLPLTTRPAHRNLQTPRGFLYNIRQHRATYAELFATLCRKAEIMCVVIHGVAKGINYNVGDKVTYKKGKNSWNAVYIDNCWHFVHSHWAAHSVNGYKTGGWTLVECDEFHTDGAVLEVQHTKKPNDFYFLTDPDKFITKCFPEDNMWQLLHKPLSKAEFEDLPFVQPAFHDLKLSIHDTHSCVIRANNGKAEVKIGIPSDRGKRYKFGYKLLARQHVESEGEYDVMLLSRYILHYIHDDMAVFELRFPIIGVFNLEIHCTDPKRPLNTDWVCDYKIICSEVMPWCEPLPIVPQIGWGPGEALDARGIESLTCKQPVVSLDGDTVTYIRFAMPKNKAIELEADFISNNQSRDELCQHVSTETDDEVVVVKVSPPGEGEYALQIFVKEENGDRKNVCNFLMHRTQIVEDPELADIRAELITATENGEVDILSHWIDKFVDRNMEDRGDLSAAKKKLHLARLNRDIREAIDRKDLDYLEKALHSASDMTIRQNLGDLAVQAEAVRSRLRRLKRLRHEVLAMDQKTISELRSYPKPPQAVHSVMAATFMLLGNKESELKKWTKIQSLIMKRGKETLKRRVAEFNIDNVSPAVLTRVHAILSRFDLETVQIASAGAATFYQWAITMAGETDPID